MMKNTKVKVVSAAVAAAGACLSSSVSFADGDEPVNPTIDPFAAVPLANSVYQVGEADRVYFFAEVGEYSFTVPSGFNATAPVSLVKHACVF